METNKDLMRQMMLGEAPVGFVVELTVTKEGDYELTSDFPFDAELWPQMRRGLAPLFASEETRPKPGSYVLCYGEANDPRILEGSSDAASVRQVMRVLIGEALDQVMESFPDTLRKMRETWEHPERQLDPVVEHVLTMLAINAPHRLVRCELTLDVQTAKRVVEMAVEGRCPRHGLSSLIDHLLVMTRATALVNKAALRWQLPLPALCNYPVADASVETLRPLFEPILAERTRVMAAKLACTLPEQMPQLATLPAAIPRLQVLASYRA